MNSSYKTRFCLLRHGETDWNRERRVQGHIDIPLNLRGQLQAEQSAHCLADTRQPFHALYVSDLARTRQTAEPIARHLGLNMRLAPQLRERHYGYLQGLTYSEMAERHPQDHQRLKTRDPHFTPHGGESLEMLCRRVEGFLVRLAEKHREQNVLIITHGGVLDIVHRLATGQPLHEPRQVALPNATLNWVYYGPHDWGIEHWGQHSHLAGHLDELLP